jgi:hypothetical protein
MNTNQPYETVLLLAPERQNIRRDSLFVQHQQQRQQMQQQMQQQLNVNENEAMEMGGGQAEAVGVAAAMMGCGLCCGLFISGLLALQLVFVFEISASDPGMQQSCGTAFWPLLLARLITGLLEASVIVAWRLQYDKWHWAHTLTRLAFAIALTVVLAKLPSGISGCNHALEQAASATHSYALLVFAFIYVVADWLGFVTGVCVCGDGSRV